MPLGTLLGLSPLTADWLHFGFPYSLGIGTQIPSAYISVAPCPTEAACALQLATIAYVQVAEQCLGEVSELLSTGHYSSGSLVLGTVGLSSDSAPTK